MFVYSGKCRLCECGIATGLTDINGNELFTGDIVIIFTENYCPHNLTVVVSNQFTTYMHDGNVKHVEDGKEDRKYFIMGIASSNLKDEWSAMLVKRCPNVVSGEHWPEFGFRYSEE